MIKHLLKQQTLPSCDYKDNSIGGGHKIKKSKVIKEEPSLQEVASLGSFSPHSFETVLYGDNFDIVQDDDVEVIYQGYGEDLTTTSSWSKIWYRNGYRRG